MIDSSVAMPHLHYPDYNILIVDDMPVNLSVIVDSLEEYGFGIRIARSGESALQRVHYDPPDLILLDVLMPGMDGFETCRRLKADPTTRDIPVIFMTALVNPADKVKGFEVGAVDYVTKPLSQEEVLARIDTHLRMRELTHSLQQQTLRLEARNRVERERLFAAVGQQREQLRALAGKLTEIQESERKQLARELHDELGQMLTAISINLGAIDQALSDDTRDTIGQRLDETRSLVEHLLEQVREISLNLRPPMLDDLGLLSALRWHVQRYADRTGINVQTDVVGGDVRLHADLETTLYRILQEALTNIARHSGADTVLLRLEIAPDQVKLYVEDNGCGFDVADVLERSIAFGSAGLFGIRERITLLGGSFHVHSVPNGGTQIACSIPRESDA